MADRANAPQLHDGAGHPYAVLFVVGVGTLLNTFAGSSVTLALPVIGREIGVGVEHTRWIVLSYLLVVTVLLPMVGRVSDTLGHRTTYQVGFALFGLGSLMAGLSRAYALLVGGRLLQGSGASMIMASGPALLTTSFPGTKRGRALGMLATATYVGLTIGPPLGGEIIARVGWHWIFLLNVPVALLMITIGQRLLPVPMRQPAGPMDVPGALTLLFAMPLLLLGLTHGRQWGWTSWRVLGASGAGAALLAGFIRVEARSANPLIDLSLFRSRAFSGASLSALANYVTLFVPIIMLPYYLMEGTGLGPSGSGRLLSVQPLVMALVASPSGWLADRTDVRILTTVGMLTLAVGVGGLATVGAHTTPWTVACWLAAMGLGTGVFISPNSSALMGAAPRGQQGLAAAILAESRTVGMLIGVAMGTALFELAGGRTGHAWRAADFEALHVAFAAAATVSVLGAVLSATARGGRRVD